MPDAYDRLAWKAGRHAVHETTADAAEVARHGVAAGDGLGHGELGQLFFAAYVSEGLVANRLVMFPCESKVCEREKGADLSNNVPAQNSGNRKAESELARGMTYIVFDDEIGSEHGGRDFSIVGAMADELKRRS